MERKVEIRGMFFEKNEILEEGKLPSFAWPGGYPLFYITDHTEQIFCPECANQNTESEITDYDVNWEDAELYCDGCGERIKSAYAEEY